MNALEAMEALAARPPAFKYPKRVLVQISRYEFKYLTVRVRKGDGHVLTRRGRLVFGKVDPNGEMIFQLAD